MTIPMFCGRSSGDLRSRYGAEYQVMGSDSPRTVRNDSVALLLADQRMPRMDGVEFLQQATGDNFPAPQQGERPSG